MFSQAPENRKLVLATTNLDKRRLMLMHLKVASLDFNIIEIGGNIQSPAELGRSEEENAVIKANYYANQTQILSLAEDDGIYFEDVIDEYQPKYLVRRIIEEAELSGKSHYHTWEDIVSRINVTRGYIIKSFALASPDGLLSTSEARIPVSISIPTSQPNLSTVTRNFLNFFMTPDGFCRPFAELDEKSRLSYSRKYFSDPIKKLFEVDL